jgi:hypothetical protein
MMDGNYVVATQVRHPWKKQFNIMAAYLWFYNPARVISLLCRPRNTMIVKDVLMQGLGMYGVTQTIRRTLGWALRLMRGRIVRRTAVPASRLPMRSAAGEPASHALSNTPLVPLGRRASKSKTN